jgi:hypothetical protein
MLRILAFFCLFIHSNLQFDSEFQDYLAALGEPSGGLNKEKQNGFAIYFCISKSF